MNLSFPILTSNVKQIDMSQQKLMHVSEMSEDAYKSFIESSEKFLEAKYTKVDPGSGSREYATVKVNGKVVAEINSLGYVSTSNEVGAKIQHLFVHEKGLQGESLAQHRADKIAEYLGGEVEKVGKIYTDKFHPAVATVDFLAMRQDPAYQQMQYTKKARQEFLAQKMENYGKL